MRRRALAWTFFWGLVAAPAIYAISLVHRYGVEVPVGDQWWISLIFDPGWIVPPAEELLRQANDSRPAFPRLIFIALAQFGEWSVRREMIATQGLLLLTLVGLASLWRRTIASSTPLVWLPLALVSLLLFSPAQYDNFLWGIQLIVFVPLACLTLFLVLATSSLSLPSLLAWSAALNVIAMYSYANGLLLWGLSLPVLLWFRWGAHRRAFWSWALWAAVGAEAFWLYFHDLSGESLTTALAGQVPSDAARALLGYLGSALSYGGTVTDRAARFEMAVFAGAVVLLAVLASAFVLLRGRTGASTDALVSWSTLFLYGFASGALTVVGRIRFGPEYLLESRYVSFSMAAPIGAAALTAAALVHASREFGLGGRVAAVCAGTGLELALAIQVILSGQHAIVRFRDTYRYRLHGKAVLTYLNLATPNDVRLVNEWSEPLVRQRARVLLDMGLLRDIRHRTSYHAGGERERATGCVESVATLLDGTVRVSGWSYLVDERRPVDAILITDAGGTTRGPIAFAIPRADRPEVVPIVGADDALQTGWEVSVPPTSGAVTAWAYDAERNEAYEITTACPTRADNE